MKEKEITGYPSVDKPWLKYYTEEQIKEKAPKMSCYENILNNNYNYLDDVALEYLSNKITYRELFKNIDKTQQAFETIGVKKNDIVTICSVTTPEVIYAFYALNKIGAIPNMIDPRYTKNAIEMFINEASSEYFVTLDLCYPKIKDIIDKTKVKEVILISPTNSAPTITKIAANALNKLKKQSIKVPTNGKYIDWNNFITSRNLLSTGHLKYEESFPAIMVHTGGTTGVPKGVLLSNDNFNNAVVQIKNCHVSAEREYRFLNIMPPFIAYGIVLGTHSPIALGWNTVVVPQFNPENFYELLNKYKPNGVMGIPTYWENVMKSKKVSKKDLQYLRDILLGGDKIKPEFEKRLNNYLQEHSCEAIVEKGYSMTEASSIATFSSKSANELESVGIPLTKTNICICEPGTTKELSYNQIGEICINTPTQMLGYYKNEIATNEVIIKHEDGLDWIHSGDIGYINSDGLLFVKDRIKRMIPRSGYKVFPSELENLFLTNPAVDACAVVGVPDAVDVTAPKAHIVLKEDYIGKENDVKNELITMFHNSTLPPYFEPVDIQFREEIPKTDIGKIDFVSLENEEKEKIKVKKLDMQNANS